MTDTKTTILVLEKFANKYAKRADFVGLGEHARADMFREFARDVRNDLLPAILAQQAATPAAVVALGGDALRFGASVVQLYDDATMKEDQMIDATQAEGILIALAEYVDRFTSPVALAQQPAKSAVPADMKAANTIIAKYFAGDPENAFRARAAITEILAAESTVVPAGEREAISKALGEILGVMHRSGFEFDRDAPLVNEANRWIEWQANAAQPRQGVELTDEIRSVLVAVRANGYACYLASGTKSSQEFMNRIDAILRATNDTGASNGN